MELWSNTYGIGTQANTFYNRTPSAFAWYKGGTHNSAAANSGGGTTLMFLSDTGALTVNALTTTYIGGITDTGLVTNLNADRLDGYHVGTTGSSYIPYVNGNGECLINTTDQGAYSLQVGGGMYADVATFGSLNVAGLNVQGISVVTRTAAATVAAGTHNLVTVASNQTLPVAPSNGDTCFFTNKTGSTFTILRNSSLIMGLSEDLSFNDVNVVTIGLRYIGGTVGWALL